MDMFSGLASGFALALSPQALMFACIGVMIGTIIGVLPGIGPITAIALLIPLSFGMEPVHGLILLSAIYYGSMYGGSITATLIRTPGEVASVVTAIDGYEMARRGRAGPALATAAVGSFIAGTAAVVGLMLLSPVLVKVAVFLGAQEYFLLMLLALMMASTLTTGSRLKAWTATLLGLAVGVIGLDPQTGTPRETFGILQLQDGIDFAIFAMALFAIPEAVNNLAHRGKAVKPMKVQGGLWMSREDWRRSRGPYARGSVLGFIIGVLPGIGPSLAAFMSYVLEKRISKHKDEFGKGAIEGVAGPEAANNAGVGGAMVPLLSLGIPGSATTALLLFVFMMYGLQPGPLLFQSNPGLVWAIIASMYVGNAVLLALNLPLVGIFIKLLSIPTPLLFSGVLAFVVLGAYALSFSLFSMLTLLVLGLIGFLMEETGVPLAPAVLALVLEPLLETNLRRALQISGGDLVSFVDRPVSLVLVLVCAGVMLSPFVSRLVTRRQRPAVSVSA
ncbi:MAG TPA: tripartite tricarboxylate transporter permease [Nocardioidaceae bacterium]|jgi:putative tricarboxylic transport membrane protein|nr:tripartite tricarboxylate transporter permease [Nocardioidaceae bacterium]